MDVVELPLERLIPYARNPRKNAAAVATVAASLKEFGWRQPIVVDEEMVILAGHTRLEAARQLGLATAPVHIARGLTPAQARAYRLMDNRASENAEWDEALLGLELGDLQGDGFDLALTGFDDAELNRLLAGLGDEGDAREGEDDIPETPADPVSRPGDLWLLGPHRLLCGDSTVATDVERVLERRDAAADDQRSTLWGGVRSRAGATRPGAAKTKRTGKVLNDDRADWREAWALFPGDVAYVWHGALHATTVAESLEVAGFAIRSQIIWAKERLVLSRGDYHWQHEPMLYCVRKTRQGALGRRPQADDALADLQPRPGRRDGPRHPEAGRVHAPTDPQQFEPRPSGLRAVHGIGHDAHRCRDHWAGLSRHRAEPGVCRRRGRALAAVHRQGRGARWGGSDVQRTEGKVRTSMNAPALRHRRATANLGLESRVGCGTSRITMLSGSTPCSGGWIASLLRPAS